MRLLRILVVEDEAALRVLLVECLAQKGHRVSAAGTCAEALARLERGGVDVILLDVGLPDGDGLDLLQRVRASDRPVEAIVITANGTQEAAVRAARSEAADFLVKPIDPAELDAALHRASQRSDAHRRQRVMGHLMARDAFFPEVVAVSPAMREAVALAGRAAASDLPVLLLGETGTGKDLLARRIHQDGARAAEPFLAVNCAALSAGLLESELFGHEKGAFTGAASLKRGLFEVADGGTLFLDEVGELAPATQSALLRVLESGELRRVGSPEAIFVDVRLVAATNHDLEAEAAAGRFRNDLYYRLNALTLRVPALRERREDLPGLVAHFAERISPRAPRGFSKEALACMAHYPWPGNVRELRNAVERMHLLLPRDRVAGVDDLPEEVRRTGEAVAGDRGSGALTLKAVERRHVARVLEACTGNKRAAARALGVTPATLYRKLKAYGLGLTRSARVRRTLR